MMAKHFLAVALALAGVLAAPVSALAVIPVAAPVTPTALVAAVVAPAPATPATPSPINPCAHRIICGAIHIWPSTAAGRERLWAQIGAAVVENYAYHASKVSAQVTYPAFVLGPPPSMDGHYTVITPLGGTNHALPFLGALGMYIGTDILSDAALSSLHVSPHTRATWQRVEAVGALGEKERQMLRLHSP
jgi:hypothetical protein